MENWWSLKPRGYPWKTVRIWNQERKGTCMVMLILLSWICYARILPHLNFLWNRGQKTLVRGQILKLFSLLLRTSFWRRRKNALLGFKFSSRKFEGLYSSKALSFVRQEGYYHRRVWSTRPHLGSGTQTHPQKHRWYRYLSSLALAWQPKNQPLKIIKNETQPL